jgi:hypothetical protein
MAKTSSFKLKLKAEHHQNRKSPQLTLRLPLDANPSSVPRCNELEP